jgi:hypothetical protein
MLVFEIHKFVNKKITPLGRGAQCGGQQEVERKVEAFVNFHEVLNLSVKSSNFAVL